MYWLGITQHRTIYRRLKSESVRNISLVTKIKPLLSHEILDLPWHNIASDIFYFGRYTYQLLVDYFSKFPEVLHLPAKSVHSVIAELRAVFTRHGIPRELVNDHVPFASRGMGN